MFVWMKPRWIRNMRPTVERAARVGVWLLVAAARPAAGEAVRNGNDFALAWTTASAAQRPKLEAAHTNLLHTFRYLRVERVDIAADGARAVVAAVEPSSDLPVVLEAGSGPSVDLARSLQPGEAVAARGRLVEFRAPDGPRFLVRPARLDFKDRLSPKAGRELLKEVDGKAR